MLAILFRGVIDSVKQEAGKLATVIAKGRAGERIWDRPIMQHFGFMSNPLPGSACLVLKEGGNFYVIASDKLSARFVLEEGEVCLYTSETNCIRIKQSGEIVVKSNSVTVDAAEVKLSNGESLKKLVTEDIIETLNKHIHAVSGAVTGPAESALAIVSPFSVAAHATSKTTAA
jgi:phage gp45-like